MTSTTKILRDLKIFEISLVYRPANPDCEFPPGFWDKVTKDD